jgi:alkaline phosphatase D
MNKVIFATGLICVFFTSLYSQKQKKIDLSSVPVVGAVAHRSASVFLEFTDCVQGGLYVQCVPDSGESIRQAIPSAEMGSDLCSMRNVTIEGLVPGARYRARIYQGKSALGDSAFVFTTKPLWEWRMPAPDFSFVAGSCLYINETQYDRPGAPYGKPSTLLRHMKSESADFNLWLGDNVYLREVDYSSPYGMLQRYLHTRKHPDVQGLLSARPNYAIWDDHDFGPNNAHRSFSFSSASLSLFSLFWPAFQYGTPETPGAFHHFSFSDADFFMMDNRYHRAPNEMDTADTEKAYWGEGQFTWLKDKLLNSRATFKFIVNGNQVLNQMTDSECLNAYPADRDALYAFIQKYKIPGIVFLSGDRHFTEVLKYEIPGVYALHDVTCSPLTSGAYAKIGETTEGSNPLRVEGTLLPEQNYMRVKVYGDRKDRTLQFEAIDMNQAVRWTLKIHEDALKPGNKK